MRTSLKSVCLSLAALVVSSSFLVGCTQAPAEQGTEGEGQIRLQWWGVFWDEAVVASLIDEYETANPNVTITYRNKWPGGQTDVATKLYQDDLERVLKNNDPTGGGDEDLAIPDIFMVDNTWVGNYERYTAPAPSSVITADSFDTAYYPAVAEDFARGNVVRGMPLWVDTLAVLYNKDLLAEVAVSAPPANWTDFKTLALQLTKRTGSTITQAGFSAGTGTNVSFAFELLNLLFVQNGVSMTDANGNPIFSTDTDSVTALAFYKSFAESGGSWNSSLKTDAALFLEGKLAMMVAPSWRLHDILAYNKAYNLQLDIGIAPMPQLQGQTIPTLNWATYWGNMVALNRPNSTESWKFIKWLSEPAQLLKLRENEKLGREFFGFLYPRVDMQQELQNDPYLKVYNAALSTAQTWYMADGLAVKSIFKDLIASSGSASDVAAAENKVVTIIANKGKL